MQATKRLCVLLTLILALPAVALAQQGPGQGPVTWLSMLDAQEGQSEALTAMIIEQNGALYQSLMEEGAIVLWGIGQPIVHRPDMDYSHVEFVVFSDWAGADQFIGKFLAEMRAMSEESHQAMREEWEKVVVPGSHYDVILRAAHFGGTPLPRPGYMNLAYFKAKPGSDMVGLFREFAEPTFEELSADGTIGHYGLDVPEIHGDPSWTHIAWYASPNLAARDKVAAALNAAEEARGEEANMELQKRFAETIDMDAHWDQIIAIVHWVAGAGAGSAEGGGEDSGEGG